ncbi:hypothetical protein HYD42_02675 [Mycoplasmopsis bovis]|nr:hypothetical protein HYD42_02675 [Mycoplasmopsis bovis]
MEKKEEWKTKKINSVLKLKDWKWKSVKKMTLKQLRSKIHWFKNSEAKKLITKLHRIEWICKK